MNSFNECKAIVDLDLDPIKVKLMHEESGEGWSRGKVDAVEPEYRRFLYLMKCFPNEQVAPLAEVDIFWHYHILDTLKYATDCEEIFGYFLHHFPYVGLRGETDEEAHEAAGDRMSELYEQTFGEPYALNGRIGLGAAGAATAANAAAYSIRVPQDAVSGSARKAAYSIRVAQNAILGSAGKAAYSIRVPQNAISGSAGKTAYSIRVPQNAISGSAGKTADSITVAQNAVSGPSAAGSGARAAARQAVGAHARSIKLQRPTLAAA